ncbi:glutathione S-transferase family protein [Seohaeicola zhoushanensis]|uniref:Glutathione S-transferase n=1 Tax=Seohaeicola zhoushanensis TaxID=1569283 RepID=A0A8J3GYL0_9RHOB|nr:glutathione S-transferase family protein [Seohaeicola zhoushanensis]GHF58537.1 glutathione S-transferase [Seohaeicola zhoushanensis]
MKLYFAPNTRAVRIAWLLEELGLPYDLERMTLGDKAMRAPEYLAVNPMGRVPVLVDGDVTISESGAIVEYLLARHGNGRLVPPADSPDFATYLQWLHFAEGMIMPQINVIMVETVFLPPERRNEVNVKRALKLLNQMLGAVDRHMEGRDYLAGDFSGADIMCGHAVSVSEHLGADLSDKPNLPPYIARLSERPALKKARAL